MDKNFEPFEMYEADRESIEEALRKPGSKARNERNALAVHEFHQHWHQSLAQVKIVIVVSKSLLFLFRSLTESSRLGDCHPVCLRNYKIPQTSLFSSIYVLC